MEYMTIAQASEKWGISGRRIQTLCASGRIPGTSRFGSAWMIPLNAQKPSDARIKSGNYIGFSQMRRERTRQIQTEQSMKEKHEQEAEAE